jgi:hypothetical protein
MHFKTPSRRQYDMRMCNYHDYYKNNSPKNRYTKKYILYFYNIKGIKGIKCQYLKKSLYQIKAFNLFFIMEFTS